VQEPENDDDHRPSDGFMVMVEEPNAFSTHFVADLDKTMEDGMGKDVEPHNDQGKKSVRPM